MEQPFVLIVAVLAIRAIRRNAATLSALDEERVSGGRR